mgnify:FL=1
MMTFSATKLASNGGWLERLDSARKSTFFYTSSEGSLRPEVVRYARRIDRISLQGEVLITDDSHMDTSGYDRVFYWKPPFGPFPAELAETYPFNAEVPEQADRAALEQAYKCLHNLIGSNPGTRFCVRLKTMEL